MRKSVCVTIRTMAVFVAMSMLSAFGGLLDNAWLKGTTNKNPLEYKPGEEMVFTLTLQRVESIPADTYFIKWSRTV